LKKILSNKEQNETAYAAAANGSIPVVIAVENVDEMGHLVLLKRELPDVNLVIFGGTEAHLIAKELAEAEISVILDSHRCMPGTWRSRNCLPGPPLSPDTNFGVLRKHGVKVGLVVADNALLGESAWEANWAARLAGDITSKETIDLVSSNIREILGLPKSKDFVIFEGDPLDFGGRLALTIEGGRITTCFPQLD